MPLKLVTGARRPVSVKQPSDLESGHEDAGAAWWSVSGPSPLWCLFCCRSGTDAVFSSCCSWTTARYAFGDEGVDLQATTAGGTSPSRAANRSHIARATGSRDNESRVSKSVVSDDERSTGTQPRPWCTAVIPARHRQLWQCDHGRHAIQVHTFNRMVTIII